VSGGTPLLTFFGVLVAQYILRKGASELETRSKREETLRVLRWAAELAVSGDEGKSRLGVSQLVALGDSALLDHAQQLFVDAALDAVIDEPVDEIDEAGDDAEVIRLPGIAGSPVSSSGNNNEGGDDG
jgi:hypothetical protein